MCIGTEMSQASLINPSLSIDIFPVIVTGLKNPRVRQL